MAPIQRSVTYLFCSYEREYVIELKINYWPVWCHWHHHDKSDWRICRAVLRYISIARVLKSHIPLVWMHYAFPRNGLFDDSHWSACCPLTPITRSWLTHVFNCITHYCVIRSVCGRPWITSNLIIRVHCCIEILSYSFLPKRYGNSST